MTDVRRDSLRPHHAARAEARLHSMLDRLLRARGWTPRVTPYVGYGADGWARLLARVLLTPPGTRPADDEGERGWRRFLCAPAAGVPVTIALGEDVHVVTSARDGYLDVRVPSDVGPGWRTARLSTSEGGPVDLPVRVVAPGPQVGLVSDIDDTVMVTMLPRPLVALRNAFLLKESARRPVPGMAALYREIVESGPDAFVVYLSTGAWNTAAALTRFCSGTATLRDRCCSPTGDPPRRAGSGPARSTSGSSCAGCSPSCPRSAGCSSATTDSTTRPSTRRRRPRTRTGSSAWRSASSASPSSWSATARRTPKDSSVHADHSSTDGAMTAPDGFGLRERLQERLRERNVVLGPRS